MKETFKHLQKSNFKKLKAMVTDAQEEPKAKKGFVKDCLVKVELQKECEEKTKDVLKVGSNMMSLATIFLVFLF